MCWNAQVCYFTITLLCLSKYRNPGCDMMKFRPAQFRSFL